MNPLPTIALFWAVVATAALLFGILCIKYGAYTAGNHAGQNTLDV